MPQPQDCGGNEQKQIASATLIAEKIGGRLGARRPRPAPAGFLAPSPRAVEVFAAVGNTAAWASVRPSVRRFFPHGRFGGRTAGRSGGNQGDGQGAARAQREGAKRCGNAAGIESHGIDQKPERQESARTGDQCASALAFFVFRFMTRPLCRYSSFLPFPSGLRALPRRPGHEPELPPCLRRRPALDARGIDVDAVGRHGPNRTHFPDAHGGVRAAAGLILLRRPWLPCEGRRVRRV